MKVPVPRRPLWVVAAPVGVAILALVVLWPRPSHAPVSQQPVTQKPTPETPLPGQVDLSVPFTPQAPTANWDATHEESCEEAAILMAMAYVHHQSSGLIPAAEAEREISALIEWGRSHGYAVDTTATQTAEIARGYYRYPKIRTSTDVTPTAVKRELTRGNLVILPLAGRRIGQPHFTPPGPWYHMLVVRGYRPGEFVTNDPGVKEGDGWLYPEATLIAAVHDWPGQKERIEEGPRAMIIVEKS